MEVETAQVKAARSDPQLRVVGSPATSASTLSVLSRCQFGVMRNVTGQ